MTAIRHALFLPGSVDVRARKGFTLIELLIVIAIIGILIAAIALAVTKAKQLAHQTDCQGRLRQVGQAIFQYHEINGRYPPAHSVPTSGSYGEPSPPDTKWYFGWAARILPYIEQDAIYKNIRWDESPWWNPSGGLPDGTYFPSKIIPLYRCPVDPHAEWVVQYQGRDVSLTSYMGVNGTDQFAYDGILHVNGIVNRAMVQEGDGTINTILVGERPASASGWYGWWFAGSGDAPYFGATDVVLGASEKRVYGGAGDSFRPGDLNDPNDEHRWHFWSTHPGGANFLFADGHVRFLSYSASGILPKLATFRGGEIVNVDF